MSAYRRNILVGLTMVGALIMLGWMILKFGDQPAYMFAPKREPVTFTTDRADGLDEGSNITYHGVIVGLVRNVKRAENGDSVIVRAELDKTPPLPANIHGNIVIVSALGGTATITLQLDGPLPEGQLKSGAQLQAKFVGSQLLPPDFGELVHQLRLVAQQLQESHLVANINQQVTKIGGVLDSANKLIGDPKLRDNLQAALVNIREASANVNKVSGKLDKLADGASETLTDVHSTVGDARTAINKVAGNVDTLTKQVGDRLEQISRTLDNLQSISAKIDQGHGTAGLLVNDPKLYQSLVDASQQLNATIVDLKRLVEQWEQEGVNLKLGK